MSGSSLDRVFEVLSWTSDLDLLPHVAAAVRGARSITFTSRTAICFDSNVFINLGKGARAADLLDYLDGQHEGPIVASTQSLLELWNNHLRSADAVAKSLQGKFSALNDAVAEIDGGYEELKVGSQKLLGEFQRDYGHVFSETVQKDLGDVLELIGSRAIVGHVPRQRFQPVAVTRKRLKVPPGFMDEGDGDFYLWADMLLALLEAKGSGTAFDAIVLVTEDKKKDWSTNGKPHPALVAEVQALLGVPFNAIGLQDLRGLVREQIDLPQGPPSAAQET